MQKLCIHIYGICPARVTKIELRRPVLQWAHMTGLARVWSRANDYVGSTRSFASRALRDVCTARADSSTLFGSLRPCESLPFIGSDLGSTEQRRPVRRDCQSMIVRFASVTAYGIVTVSIIMKALCILLQHETRNVWRLLPQ